MDDGHYLDLLRQKRLFLGFVKLAVMKKCLVDRLSSFHSFIFHHITSIQNIVHWLVGLLGFFFFVFCFPLNITLFGGINNPNNI